MFILTERTCDLDNGMRDRFAGVFNTKEELRECLELRRDRHKDCGATILKDSEYMLEFYTPWGTLYRLFWTEVTGTFTPNK